MFLDYDRANRSGDYVYEEEIAAVANAYVPQVGSGIVLEGFIDWIKALFKKIKDFFARLFGFAKEKEADVKEELSGLMKAWSGLSEEAKKQALEGFTMKDYEKLVSEGAKVGSYYDDLEKIGMQARMILAKQRASMDVSAKYEEIKRRITVAKNKDDSNEIQGDPQAVTLKINSLTTVTGMAQKAKTNIEALEARLVREDESLGRIKATCAKQAVSLAGLCVSFLMSKLAEAGREAADLTRRAAAAKRGSGSPIRAGGGSGSPVSSENFFRSSRKNSGGFFL